MFVYCQSEMRVETKMEKAYTDKSPFKLMIERSNISSLWIIIYYLECIVFFPFFQKHSTQISSTLRHIEHPAINFHVLYPNLMKTE